MLRPTAAWAEPLPTAEPPSNALSPAASGNALVAAEPAGAPAAATDPTLQLSLVDLLRRGRTFVGVPVRNLGLTEIVATDNPFELEARKLPLTVEVMKRETMTGRGIKNVVEATSSLVGVTSGESPGEPYSFGMRGFSRDSVMVLYDGIAMGESTLNMRPLSSYNLERVEVLKGPVAFHHGQAAAGGTINFVPRRPDPLGPAENSFLLGLGTNHQTSFGVESRAPLGGDLFYRASVARNATSGWVRDSASETIDLQGALLWAPRRGLDVTASVLYASDDLPAYWGTPLLPAARAQEPISGLVDTDDGRVVDRAARFRNYNVVNHVLDSRSRWDRLDVDYRPNEALTWRSSLYHYTARRNWRNAESYVYDAETDLIARDRLSVRHARELFGIATTLTWLQQMGSVRNRAALGGGFSRNDFDRSVGFEHDGAEAGDTTSVDAPGAALFGSVTNRNDRMDVVSLSATLEDRLELTPSLSLSGAAKVERVGVDIQRFHVLGTPRSGQLHHAYDQAAFKAAIGYVVTPALTTYAHWARQHDLIQGDITLDSVSKLGDFRPSTVSQLEAGVKSQAFDDALEATLAVFHIEKSLLRQLGDEAPRDMQQRSIGLELAVKADVTHRIELGGGAAWLNARFGDGYVFFGDPASGQTPPNTPSLMLNGWFSIRDLGFVPLEVGAGLGYVSERPANGPNTVRLAPYTLLDGVLSYTGHNYRIGAHVRNLFDKVYAPWADVNYPNQVLLGPPRSFEVNLRVGL